MFFMFNKDEQTVHVSKTPASKSRIRFGKLKSISLMFTSISALVLCAIFIPAQFLKEFTGSGILSNIGHAIYDDPFLSSVAGIVIMSAITLVFGSMYVFGIWGTTLDIPYSNEKNKVILKKIKKYEYKIKKRAENKQIKHRNRVSKKSKSK